MLCAAVRAAPQTIKLSTTLLSIYCAIRLISFLMMSSLVRGLFSQTLSFRYFPEKIIRRVEILGIGWPRVWREMSLFDGKLCLRYSSVLFKKWGTILFQTTILNRTLEYFRHNFSWDWIISHQTDNPWLSYS